MLPTTLKMDPNEKTCLTLLNLEHNQHMFDKEILKVTMTGKEGRTYI